MSAILYKDNPYGGTTSVTDAGHVLVTEGTDTVTAQAKFNTQTTAIQRILGNFATVEESTTASKAYNVGDYLVLNSFLCKVTQAIAAGGTIDNTQNGNVVKTNAGAEFKNANFPEADNVSYENTTSGLTATNVQDALDEVNGKTKPTDVQLHASDNLDNISQTGTYFWVKENDSYPSNVPESVNSGMIVISRGNIPIQIVITNNLSMFFRVKYTSGWQGWRKVTATAV